METTRKVEHDWKLQIVYEPLSKLKAWEKNPRTGTDAAASKLAASIEKVGFINPIVATPDGVIRAGHTRLAAAQQLGLTEVPVIYVPFGSEAEAEMYAIADNRASEWTKWNREILSKLMVERQSIDVRKLASTTGFSSTEIGALQALGAARANEDIIPPPPKEAKTPAGAIYVLGKHRLLCGDAGNAMDVQKLLGGKVADLAHTDPPYNVAAAPRTGIARVRMMQETGQYHSRFTRYGLLSGSKEQLQQEERPRDRMLLQDAQTDKRYLVTLRQWFKNMIDVIKPGGSVYVWGGYCNNVMYPEVLQEYGVHYAQAIIWVKAESTPSRRDFMSCHEWCFYGWKEGAEHYFHPDIKNARDVWEINRVVSSKRLHLTEKPVELARRAIEYSSQHGELVLDLFAGSGSTLIAGEELDRPVYSMELDPVYCDVIVQRWEAFSGKKARMVKP